VHVQDIRFVDTAMDPDYEFPLGVLTEQAYADIPQKTQTSNYPSERYYNPTYPLATLNLFPVPTSSTLTGVIYHWAALGTFAATSTAFSLPPAYERMVVKNLALELAPSYDKEPSALLLRQAANSMDAVRRGNKRLTDLSFEAAALIQSGNGGYNFREG